MNQCSRSFLVLDIFYHRQLSLFKHDAHLSLCTFSPVAPVEVEPIVTGCSVDQECPDYNSCINNRCADPCVISDPCATNAFCKVLNHQPKCSCPEGYIGDPRVECKPRKTSFKTILFPLTLPNTRRHC